MAGIFMFDNPTGSYGIELINKLLVEINEAMDNGEEFETEEEMQEFIEDFKNRNMR